MDETLQKIAELTQLIEENPKDPINYLNRVKVLLSAGQKKEALNDLDVIIDELGVEHIDPYMLRAQMRLSMGDKMGAIEDYTKIAKMEPGLLDSLNGVVESLSQKCD